MLNLNPHLVELFRAHGVDSTNESDHLVFRGSLHRARAAIVQHTTHAAAVSAQLDVRVEIEAGLTIVESFAGMAATTELAARDALVNFTTSSFHVLLAVLFGGGANVEDHVLREEWLVGGRRCRVTIGDVTMRGKPPVDSEALAGWFDHFKTAIALQPCFRPGTNWVRVYYGQTNGKPVGCEVMLNNSVWEPMQSRMEAYAWPLQESFYSVRAFMIVEVDRDVPVGPADAVVWIGDILSAATEFSADAVYSALLGARISDRVAGRALNFAQTAWARVLFADLGVQFSPDYVCFDAEGREVERGRLADERYFQAATQLAPRYIPWPAVRQCALASSEVGAVNRLLHSGSKPKDLVTGPVFVFLDPPTAAGLQGAREQMSSHLNAVPRHTAADPVQRATAATSPRQRPASRPWWQFWRK